MIGILIVCHGDLAGGLLNSMSLIIGEQEKMEAIGLYEEDSIDNLPERIEQKIDKLQSQEGVLIFVDIIGASPFNACARVIHEKPDQKLALITGVNLPMLLEAALNREKDLSLEDLTQEIKEIGKDQIKTLSEFLK